MWQKVYTLTHPHMVLIVYIYLDTYMWQEVYTLTHFHMVVMVYT